jgi:hypothetical protein
MDSPKTPCEQIQTMIDEMSQAALQQPQDQGPISEHVRQCPACQDYLQKALALAGHLDRWEVPEPRGNIAASVMAQIAQKEHDKQVDGSRFWRQVHAVMLYRLHVPAAAAILLLIILAVSISMNITSWQRPDTRSVVIDVPAHPQQLPTKTVQYTTTRSRDSRSTDQETVHTYDTHPGSTPGALIIILGTPPVFPPELIPESIEPSTENHI